MKPSDTIVRHLDNTTARLDTIVQAALVAIMISLLILLNVQVLLRHVIRTPLIWGGELGGFLLAYVTLWGSSHCIRTDKHVRVRYVESLLPSVAMRRVLSIVIHAIVLFYLYYLIVYGYQFAELGIGEKTTSQAFEFFWPRLSVASGGVLMAIQTINILLREAVCLLRGSADSADQAQEQA